MHKLSEIHVGQVLPTNTYGDVVVLDVINWRKIRVLFLEYSYEVTVEAGNLFKGSIKNPMHPIICNIGFFGVGSHAAFSNGKITKAYHAWSNMLKRVYEPESKHDIQGYHDVTVHSDWYNFQNFAEWYHKQIDHFGEVDFTWEIDKDLLIPGNRIYGPNTCCVIPEQINIILIDCASSRGELPLGVTRTQKGKPYRVRVNSFGKTIYLGRYQTLYEAQYSYWTTKFKIIQNATMIYWKYIPEHLAMRLINFNWSDAFEYYGNDALIQTEALLTKPG